MLLLGGADMLSPASMLDMTMLSGGKGKTHCRSDAVDAQHRIALSQARAAPGGQRTRLRERVQKQLKGGSGRTELKVCSGGRNGIKKSTVKIGRGSDARQDAALR